MIEKIKGIFKQRAKATFIIDSESGKEYRYAEFFRLAGNLSFFLRERGIGEGDKIVSLISGRMESVILYFAALFAGAVIVPVNYRSPFEDIRYIVEQIDPKAIMLSEKSGELFNAANSYWPSRLVIFGKSGGGTGSITLNELENNDSSNFKISKQSPDALFSITFTSGTTAFPKGVMHSISNLFGNAAAFNEFTGIKSENRFYHVLPMFYMAGFLNMLISPFMAGSTVVIGREFSPAMVLDFWEAPMRYRIDSLWLVPTILAILNKIICEEKSIGYCRDHVKNLFVGTAPLTLKTKREFEAKFGVQAMQSYGLSELLIISINCGRGYDLSEESVGRCLKGVRVTDKDGELLVKTPYRMLGYYPKIEKTDKWFASGDLGKILPGGEILISGREKDLIIKGGYNISPAAVEKVLDDHEAIESAKVIGVPDDCYGESVVAVLKLRPGNEFEKVRKELLGHCRERLSEAQRPSHYYDLKDFPTNFIGKVKKDDLKKIILERMAK